MSAAVRASGNNFGLYAVRDGDYVEFTTVTFTNTSFTLLSVICNVTLMVIILRTPNWYSKWRHRFPFYLALVDLLWNVVGLSQMIYMITTMRFLDRVPCLIVGALIGLFIDWHFMLVAATAVTIYLRVCRDVCIDYGSYDWKYHVVCMLYGAMRPLIGLPINAFGTGPYFCLHNVSTLGGQIMILEACIILIINLSVISWSYFRVIRKIREAESTYKRQQVTGENVQRNTKLAWSDKVIKKMFVYVMIFTMKWVPTIPIYASGLLGVDTMATNVVMSIMSHVGSPLNLLHYIYREKAIGIGHWIKKRSMPTSIYDDGSKISPPRRPMSTLDRSLSGGLRASYELASREQASDKKFVILPESGEVQAADGNAMQGKFD